MNSEKTSQANETAPVMQSFVSGINCYPGTAREEMLAVKHRFGKEDGTVAYHGYQSFAPGEATPALAHQIGIELAQKLWGEKYQVVVATHLDHENHLHNHFVLNTVSFLDGVKYHRTERDYYEMRKTSDMLCRKYRLSVIEDPRGGKAKHYGEWRAEQEQRPTWRGLVRNDVEEAIRQSMTERQFYDALHKKGYEVKVGKDISVRPPGKERFVRLGRNFGEMFTPDGIRKQILSQHCRVLPEPEPQKRLARVRFKGKFHNTQRATGFRALYLHYCYLLGYLPKSDQQRPNKHIHFLLREDLIKMDTISEEAKLLVRHRIDTGKQLSSYKEALETKVQALTADRKALYKKQRTVAVRSDEERTSKVKAEITALSKELAAIRREMRLCDDIAVRSGVMKEKIKAVREDERSKGKEQSKDEQFRRRSGTDRQA